MTLHRSNACILKEQPIVHFIPLSCSLGKADLVLGIIPLDKIVHDRPRFKQVNGFPISKRVRQRRDTPVGVDVEKPWLLLRVL